MPLALGHPVLLILYFKKSKHPIDNMTYTPNSRQKIIKKNNIFFFVTVFICIFANSKCHLMIGWIIVIVVLLTIFLIPVGIVIHFISLHYNRREKELRDESEAHRKILEGTYDRIWNNIKLRSNINEKHRRSFNNIYPDLLDQSINNEQFIDWILTCDPDFSPEEYVPLLESIALDREKFVTHQRRMLSVIKEHRMLLTSKPSKWLIKDTSAIHYVPMDTEYARWGRSL